MVLIRIINAILTRPHCKRGRLEIGHFSMHKKNAREIKSFQGEVDIPISWDKNISIDFRYPDVEEKHIQ